MDIKRTTGADALKLAEKHLQKIADDAAASMAAQARETILAIRDAAEALQTLNTGVSDLLDRATSIMVKTFTTDSHEPWVIDGTQLVFCQCHRVVQMTPEWHGYQRDEERQLLDKSTRYRAIVILETLEKADE